MARGSNAKIEVQNIIATAFGSNYLGEYDKKIYVWANDGNGEKVQIAISLTCPKTPIEFDATIDNGGDWDFTDDAPKAQVAVSSAPPAEITEQEKQNIADLMARLGL